MKYREMLGKPFLFLQDKRIKTPEGMLSIFPEKHTDKIIAAMELESCRRAATRVTSKRTREEVDTPAIDKIRVGKFRTVVGVARFLRNKRPDTGLL